jgi:hypothetical protein
MTADPGEDGLPHPPPFTCPVESGIIAQINLLCSLRGAAAGQTRQAQGNQRFKTTALIFALLEMNHERCFKFFRRLQGC